MTTNGSRPPEPDAMTAITTLPFVADAARRMDVDGHRVIVSFGPPGWVSAVAPLSGPPEALLARQLEIQGTAKVAAGPSLRADFPVLGSPEPGIAAALGALREGLAVLAGASAPFARGASAHTAAVAALEDYASSCAWPWRRTEGGWAFTVGSAGSSHRIVAAPQGSHVHASCPLVDLRDPGPLARRALTHFLLALNARLRLVRASLSRDRISLEVALPGHAATAWLLGKAFDALTVGARMARRECAVLLDPAVADAYCTFHNEEKETSS